MEAWSKFSCLYNFWPTSVNRGKFSQSCVALFYKHTFEHLVCAETELVKYRRRSQDMKPDLCPQRTSQWDMVMCTKENGGYRALWKGICQMLTVDWGNWPASKFFIEKLWYDSRMESPHYLVPDLGWYHRVLCGSGITSVAWTNMLGP